MRQRKAATPLLPQHRGNLLVNPSRRKRRQGRQRCRRVSIMAALMCCAVVMSLVVLLLFGESSSSISASSHPLLHKARSFTKHQVAKIIDKVKKIPKGQRPNFPVVTCSDGKTKEFLNDNYCDCLDGSDEPDTAACAAVTVGQATFACHIDNDNDYYIFASRVHDGVRDCPNGRDEM